MTKITRRAALIGAMTSTAALAVPAAAMLPQSSQQQTAPTIAALIAAHRSAYEACEAAVSRYNAVEHRLVRDVDPPRVPRSMLPDGQWRGHCELGPMSADEIRREVAEVHQRLRAQHTSPWLPAAVVAGVSAQIDTSEATCLAALDDAIVLSARRRRHPELIEADAETDRADEVESEARLALILARPVNPAEAKAKAEYIAEAPAFLEGWAREETAFAALLERLCEVAPEATQGFAT